MADGSSCGSSLTLYAPGGDPFDVPAEDFYQDTLPEAEVWQEVSRDTSTVNVSGVSIERIESVTFDRGSGKLVTLNFNN